MDNATETIDAPAPKQKIPTGLLFGLILVVIIVGVIVVVGLFYVSSSLSGDADHSQIGETEAIGAASTTTAYALSDAQRDLETVDQQYRRLAKIQAALLKRIDRLQVDHASLATQLRQSVATINSSTDALQEQLLNTEGNLKPLIERFNLLSTQVAQLKRSQQQQIQAQKAAAQKNTARSTPPTPTFELMRVEQWGNTVVADFTYRGASRRLTPPATIDGWHLVSLDPIKQSATIRYKHPTTGHLSVIQVAD